MVGATSISGFHHLLLLLILLKCLQAGGGHLQSP